MGKLQKFISIYLLLSSTIILILVIGSFRSNIQSQSQVDKKMQKLTEEVEKINAKNLETEKILGELEEIKSQLHELDQKPEVLGTDLENASSNALKQKIEEIEKQSLGYITIIDKANKTINLYKETSTSSSVVGKAQFGQKYAYSKIEGNWYMISIENNITGWISSLSVKEVEK